MLLKLCLYIGVANRGAHYTLYLPWPLSHLPFGFALCLPFRIFQFVQSINAFLSYLADPREWCFITGNHNIWKLVWFSSEFDHAATTVIHPDSRLQVVISFYYLGVQFQLLLLSYIANNVCPLISRLKYQTRQCIDLPLDLMGRANILKIIYLPKLLYTLANSPCRISKSIFKQIDTVCTFYCTVDLPE